MTDAISGNRPIRQDHDHDAQPTPIARGVRELDVASVATPRLDLGRLAQSMAVSRASSSGVTSVAERLDAVRDAFSGPYRVAGQSVVAPPQFRMKGGFQDSTFFAPAPNQSSTEAFVRSMTPRGREVFRILTRAGVASAGAVMLGYGKPAALVKATQALIDAGKLPRLPSPATLSDCVRKMQWENGIGVDCVDYSMNALAAVRGTTVEALGLVRGSDPFGRDGNVKPEHFSRQPATGLRPGDIVTLKDPDPNEVGHRVIVRDHHVVTGPSDPARGAVVAQWGATASAFFAGTGPFHVVHVDSSWGAEADGKPFGGYRSDTWVLDEGSKRWMSFSPHTGERGVLVSADGPAGEIFAGAYRYGAR